MALNLILPNVIDLAGLREAVGRPTLDTADPGYVPDATLEAIIQRHHDNAYEAALALVDGKADAGEVPGPTRLFAPATIALSAEADQTPLWGGDIPAASYPFVLGVTDGEGQEYQADPHIRRTANTAFWPVHAYAIVGRRIYVIGTEGITTDPGTPSLRVHLAPTQDLVIDAADGKLTHELNAAIITEARSTVGGITNEGNRQQAAGQVS